LCNYINNARCKTHKKRLIFVQELSSYSEIYANHLNVVCFQNVEFLTVIPGGTF